MAFTEPHPLGRGVILDAAATKRVCDFVAPLGIQKAAARLRVGPHTLEAACGGSRMQRATAERLLAAVAREAS